MYRRQKWQHLSVLLVATTIGVFSSTMPVMAISPALQRAAIRQQAAIIEQPLIGQTTVNLNLRSGPGTNFARLAVIPRAGTVEVLGRNAIGDWLYVMLDPATNTGMAVARGWVYATYIQSTVDIVTLPIVDDTLVFPTPVPPTLVISTPVANPTITLSPTPKATAYTTPTARPTMVGPIVVSPTPTSTPIPTSTPTPTGTEMTVLVSPMSVQANTPVHLLITSAPPHTVLRAVLSQSNGAKAMPIAAATADSKGLAAMDFVIPGEWADHTPIVDHTLLLTINTPDQNLKQTVSLHYQVQ